MRDFRKVKSFDFTAAIVVLLWVSTAAECLVSMLLPFEVGEWVLSGSIARGIFNAEFPELGPERESPEHSKQTDI